MSYRKTAKKIIESIGKNTSPVYAVVAIASANAIFKPLSTLTDKKEKKETKEYTALREFLTECVAVPTYIICHKIAENGANLIKDTAKVQRAKSNLGFVGVCIAAVFVIPALCSVVIKPMTDRIYRKSESKVQPQTIYPQINNNNSKANLYPLYNNNFNTFRKGGLKV